MRPERWWYGTEQLERAVRGALTPAEAVFASAVRARNALYDRGILRAHPAAIPVVSVGNLTVGGTGKTPVVADIVGRLLRHGARPAVVLRGHRGGDEAILHRWLNPGAAVMIGGDRALLVARAAAAGCDVAVLDDAFQHRRIERALDIVLVSAEQWSAGQMRMLPAGPARELPDALVRATTIVVTRKAASPEAAELVSAELGCIAPYAARAIAALIPARLQRSQPVAGAVRGASGAAAPAGSLDPAALAGSRVLAVAGIGDPGSFFAQLRALGGEVTPRAYADHHAYTAGDVREIVALARSHNYVVTTQKDLVRLLARWPAGAPPLWYVSQVIQWADGAGIVAGALRAVLERRA